jgi:hypothetical protein
MPADLRKGREIDLKQFWIAGFMLLNFQLTLFDSASGALKVPYTLGDWYVTCARKLFYSKEKVMIELKCFISIIFNKFNKLLGNLVRCIQKVLRFWNEVADCADGIIVLMFEQTHKK